MDLNLNRKICYYVKTQNKITFYGIEISRFCG